MCNALRRCVMCIAQLCNVQVCSCAVVQLFRGAVRATRLQIERLHSFHPRFGLLDQTGHMAGMMKISILVLIFSSKSSWEKEQFSVQFPNLKIKTCDIELKQIRNIANQYHPHQCYQERHHCHHYHHLRLRHRHRQYFRCQVHPTRPLITT